jgi:hypothetical protein
LRDSNGSRVSIRRYLAIVASSTAVKKISTLCDGKPILFKVVTHRVTTPSYLGRDDLLPDVGLFLLVGRPDLLSRDLPERLDISGIDRHAFGFGP